LTVAGSSVSLDVDDAGHTGMSNSFTVNHAVAESLAVSPGSTAITAGNRVTFLAVASDAYGNVWDVTSSTSWSISAGAGGSWSSNIYTSAMAGSWTVSATYASKVYNVGLMVGPAGLDHFVFGVVGAQVSGVPFSVLVTAKDAFGNTAISYNGTPSLTCSAGSINPGTMSAFVAGVGSTSVNVELESSNITITVTDDNHVGNSNSFTMTIASTPTPTPTTTATPTPAPTPSHTPAATSTPAPTPTPTFSTAPTPTATIVPTPVSSLIAQLTQALPPFTFSDISLLLAFGAIILLITAELPYPHCGLTNLTINKKKLRNTISVIGLLFLITIAVKAISILST
jgi:hypothetical protein